MMEKAKNWDILKRTDQNKSSVKTPAVHSLYQNWSLPKSHSSHVVNSVKPVGMGAPSLWSLVSLLSAIAHRVWAPFCLPLLILCKCHLRVPEALLISQ